MGRHRKPPRIKIPPASATAVPAIAGVAATVCMSSAAPAEAAVTRPPVLALTQQSTSAWTPGAFLARENALAAAHRTPLSYRVRPGDTLSSIAAHVYHNRADWPVIYWRNHRQIRWANQIKAGQVLHIPAKPARAPHAPSRLGPPAPAPSAASSGAGAAPVRGHQLRRNVSRRRLRRLCRRP